MKPTIYVDLDGTLLGHRASLLHDAQGNRTNVGIDALHKAEVAGADIVIATGRDIYRTTEFARSVGISKFIAELGSVIKTTDQEIIEVGEFARAFIEENGLSEVEFINTVMDAGHFLISKNKDQLEMHAPYNRDRHTSILMRGNIDVAASNDLLAKNGWPFLEIVANGHGMFRRTMPNVENVLIYHLTPKGVTKSSGIAADQKLRGISKENSFMIGDGMADAHCHENVHTLYMPSNGPQSDEEVAQYIKQFDNIVVLEKSHNEGFAQAIDLILEKYC